MLIEVYVYWLLGSHKNPEQHLLWHQYDLWEFCVVIASTQTYDDSESDTMGWEISPAGTDNLAIQQTANFGSSEKINIGEFQEEYPRKKFIMVTEILADIFTT